jgi:hypothetical protein
MINNPVTAEDGEALQTSLIEHLNKYGASANTAALLALGKYHNTKDAEILRIHLGIHLKLTLNHSRGLYNALDALNRCGEISSKGNSSGTNTEVDPKNWTTL